MTYCVALCLNEGLVFLSDTRTNAGVDQVGIFRKMTIFQKKKDRVFTLLSAGNLAITQSVKEVLNQGKKFHGINLWNAKNTYEAAMVVGEAVRNVHERDFKSLETAGIEFNCNLIFGGQVKGEKPRLFNVYSAGNFIESTPETCYFQIGEAKYGKPILDRVVNFSTPLNIATKCALISMDSTLKSNISVGLPLDLLVYEKDTFLCDQLVTIDESNPYFEMIHQYWGEQLKKVFMEIEEPIWNEGNKKLSIVSKPKKLGPVPIIAK
jgi:putative proteasome-type protease